MEAVEVEKHTALHRPVDRDRCESCSARAHLDISTS